MLQVISKFLEKNLIYSNDIASYFYYSVVVELDPQLELLVFIVFVVRVFIVGKIHAFWLDKYRFILRLVKMTKIFLFLVVALFVATKASVPAQCAPQDPGILEVNPLGLPPCDPQTTCEFSCPGCSKTFYFRIHDPRFRQYCKRTDPRVW